jgi:hypothetical protein
MLAPIGYFSTLAFRALPHFGAVVAAAFSFAAIDAASSGSPPQECGPRFSRRLMLSPLYQRKES